MDILIILSNYLHDLSTGLLFAASLLMVRSRKLLLESGRTEAFLLLYREYRWILGWSLGAILILGIPRMIFFETHEFIPAVTKGLVVALVIKHILLAGAVGLGILWWYQMDKSIKRLPRAAKHKLN